MYYLIRTGHIREAAAVASDFESALAKHEELFATFIKAWAESADRRYVHSLFALSSSH